MTKRKGRKPKTLKEKRQEIKENLERVLRIASVFHNLQRNKQTRRTSKSHLKKFSRELRATRDPGEKETLKFLLKDYQSTVEKMESFIKEDASFLNKELGVFRLIGPKK